MRNKLFYGQMGCKDLLLTKWKDLSDFVTLECDGQDMTPKLKEHRVHAILFLNIASYGGGTHPWSASSGTREPAMDDGLIEVVGLTTYQLPLLQARGHGTCIVQCSTAKLVTTKTIPMQASIISRVANKNFCPPRFDSRVILFLLLRFAHVDFLT